jgi:hypothetical protein
MDSAIAVPPASRALSLLLPVSFFLSVAAPTTIGLFALVPTNTFIGHMRPWILLTSVVYEARFVSMIVGILATLFWARHVESAWGTPVFVRFAVVVALLTNVSIVLLSIFLYASHVIGPLYQYYTGSLPLVMGLAVAMWQQGPDNTVAGPVRFTNVPVGLLLFVALYEVFAAPAVYPTENDVGKADDHWPGSVFLPAALGWFYSWFYLRFLQERNGVVGDPSTTFALHMMFPLPLRVVVLLVSVTLFPLIRLIGLGARVDAELSRAQQKEEDNRIQVPNIVVVRNDPANGGRGKNDMTAKPLPGSNETEADRRRKIALNALAERLERARQAESTTGAANGKDGDELDF